MSGEFTAQRLLDAGALLSRASESVVKHVQAQIDGEELTRFGLAWQAEVKALRERIAALETEREQLDAAIDGLINDLQHADQIMGEP